ncbi:DUF4177 domain-containing protein [Cohnella terricola]|uniref:DUF4177 domain-containing protein n=1 Tax=Cohnella terricola TaxID=1289167 RepID=A0A559JCW7_9BACL|nr:DUF4177 domain-containing protein [Cohnella terricola]TVX97725.1 DUF4177 domain-containing protein [Cohnella terricola]
MEKWEYKTLEFMMEGRGFLMSNGLKLDKFDDAINLMGDDGWELINTFTTNLSEGMTHQILCIFKRRKA